MQGTEDQANTMLSQSVKETGGTNENREWTGGLRSLLVILHMGVGSYMSG